MRILFACPNDASFIRIDRELLAERWPLQEWRQPGRFTNLARLLPRLLRSDVVVGWWASWHTFWPITLAWLLRKPSLLIIGGFDTAAMPDIGYGYQLGGPRRWFSRFVMRRATRLVTNSRYSQAEIERNLGFPPERVTVIHHGIPDPHGALPDGDREPIALNVGLVTRDNLEIKGQRLFVEAAAHAPEVVFVLAGPWKDSAIDALHAAAGANVAFTDWLEQADLESLFSQASVYVQPSRHEGFGMAVAEAMLAGCIPVVSAAGALPEVVGDTGVLVEGDEPQAVAEAVRRGLQLGPEARQRARQRVLDRFPVATRRERLQAEVEALTSRV